MTTRDYIRVAREQWIIIVAITAIGLVAAGCAFLFSPKQYTATSSVYVSAQMGSDPQQAYVGAQLSADRVKSYTELVTGSRVLKEAAQRLGLSDEDTRELASHVSASNAIESVIITISATEPSPQQAARVSNTVAEVLSDTVEEIERPDGTNGSAPVSARVVEPADPPVDPSSLGLVLWLVLGLVGGLAVGVAVAAARHALDTGIKSSDDLARAGGLTALGAVAFDDGVGQRPLAVYDKPHGAVAEGIRSLRTNLQFLDVDNDGGCKVVTVTSSVAGEGKTTTVANLAVALAAAGTRVLVIEADMRRPKLSEMFGAERAVGLTRVLSGRVALHHAIQTWGGSVDILPSGPVPPNPSELMASDRMRTLIADARRSYDVVLVDTPPLLPVTDAAAVAPATDGAVLVCRHRRTTEAQVRKAVAALRAVSVEPVGAVLTMVPRGPRAESGYESYAAIEGPLVTVPVDRSTGPGGTAVHPPGTNGATGGYRVPAAAPYGAPPHPASPAPSHRPLQHPQPHPRPSYQQPQPQHPPQVAPAQPAPHRPSPFPQAGWPSAEAPPAPNGRAEVGGAPSPEGR